MADAISRLKMDSSQYEGKIKRATQLVMDMEAKVRKTGATFAIADKEELQFVGGLGKLDTAAKSARGKLGELGNTIQDLSIHYKKLTDEEKASPYGKALKGSIDELIGRHRELQGQISSTSKEMSGNSSILGQLSEKMGMSLTKAGALGAAMGAMGVAAKVAQDAFMATESGIDEWGRTVEGAKGAYSVFLDTLNGGNWSGFFANLNDAVKGARDLYDALDRLGSVKANNAAAIAIVQKQIQELRVLKQQGKDVDAQLEAAVKKLARLQKQEVVAGQKAGRSQIEEVIMNKIRGMNTTGANVSEAAVKKAISMVINGGQDVMDAYTHNANALQAKGTKTTTSRIYATDGSGRYTTVRNSKFDLGNLSSAEQTKYLIAKAIKEGESQIQAGISTYAEAMRSGANASREEFKGNRYAGVGSGSGKKSGTASSSGMEAAKAALEDWGKRFDEEVDAAMKMDEALATLNSQMENLGEKKKSSYEMAVPSEKSALQAIKEQMDYNDQLIDQLESIIEGYDGLGEAGEEGFNKATEALKNLQDQQLQLGAQAVGEKKNEDDAKERKTTKTLTEKAGQLASGISTIASGIQTMGVTLPKGLTDAINVIQGLMSVVQGVQTVVSVFGTTSMAANTAALSANTAALIANTATGLIPGFAGGGVAHAASGLLAGNHLSGDLVPVMVNSGELILNRAQQGAIANQLQGGGLGGNMKLEAKLSGEIIRLALKNNDKRRR